MFCGCLHVSVSNALLPRKNRGVSSRVRHSGKVRLSDHRQVIVRLFFSRHVVHEQINKMGVNNIFI